MPIYLWSQGGVIKTFLCNERVVHVHYVAIGDLVITTPLTGGGAGHDCLNLNFRQNFS